MSQAGKFFMNGGPGPFAETFDTDSGSAVPTGAGVITIAGGDNINTAGSGNTVTVNLDTSIVLPNTNAAGTEGLYSLGAARFMHNYGSNCTFVGSESGNLTHTSVDSVGIGYQALQNITNGAEIVAIGSGAGSSLTTADASVFVGKSAGAAAVGNADNCTFVGHAAGITCDAEGNTLIGSSAGSAITSGEGNCAIGYSVLGVDTGEFNIAIGNNAGTNYIAAESYNVLVGYNVMGDVGESNVMRLGSNAGASTIADTYVAGIYQNTVTGTGEVVVVDSDGKLGSVAGPATFAWQVITMDQNIVPNEGYICNKAGTLALALPATSAVGDIVEITGINTATGWQVTQGAGQTIYFGTSATTTGAGGSLTSSAIRDSIKMVCVVADTDWNVISSVGNITVV